MRARLCRDLMAVGMKGQAKTAILIGIEKHPKEYLIIIYIEKSLGDFLKNILVLKKK